MIYINWVANKSGWFIAIVNRAKNSRHQKREIKPFETIENIWKVALTLALEVCVFWIDWVFRPIKYNYVTLLYYFTLLICLVNTRGKIIFVIKFYSTGMLKPYDTQDENPGQSEKNL